MCRTWFWLTRKWWTWGGLHCDGCLWERSNCVKECDSMKSTKSHSSLNKVWPAWGEVDIFKATSSFLSVLRSLLWTMDMRLLLRLYITLTAGLYSLLLRLWKKISRKDKNDHFYVSINGSIKSTASGFKISTVLLAFFSNILEISSLVYSSFSMRRSD